MLAIRDAGSPYPYPELDDEPDLPRLARAGRHVAPPKRYLRDIGVEVDATEVAATVAAQARAGNGWVKLVGDWIDRGVGDLAPAWDADTLTAAVAGRARRRGTRRGAHLLRVGRRDHGAGRGGLGGARHRAQPRPDRRDGPPGHRADPHDDQHCHLRRASPSRRGASSPGTPSTCSRCATASPRWCVPRTRPGCRSTWAPTPAAASTTASPPRRCCCCTSGPACRTIDVLAAASWGAREWLGFPGLVEGGLADLTVYPEDPRGDLRVVRAPSRIDPARPRRPLTPGRPRRRAARARTRSSA